MLLEGGKCLLPQGNAIHKKKHFFGMSAPHQGIDEGNTGTGFSGASGHNQKEVPFFLLNSFKHRANGTNLIIAPGNGCVNQLTGERFAAPANVLEALKVVTGWKPDNFSRRVVV